MQYLVCETPGVDPNDPCDTAAILNHPYIVLNTCLTVVFYGLSPVMHLMFVISLQKTKEKCLQLCMQCRIEPETGQDTRIELETARYQSANE